MGTFAMYKKLDELCSSSIAFLSFSGHLSPEDDGGSITSFKGESEAKPSFKSERPIDREKLIRYVNHAREALDCGDTALAKEWLSEISEHLKK